MEWWDKMIVPMKEACAKVAKCLGFKKTGLVKLKHDVRNCEYEDVRILWEMLKKNDTDLEISSSGGGGSGYTRKKKRFSRVVEWAKRAPMLCHHGV